MKTSLFVIAAVMTIGVITQSPSAQTANPHKMTMEELTQTVPSKSSPAAAAAAHWKADDAMAKALLLPPTEDAKKVAAAMTRK